ncbi:MAG: 30S ribosomal protein S2 [Ignavibacteriae bacterium]|nr:30S ribosomal protein S2 [Ignavibacteriota bacterium]
MSKVELTQLIESGAHFGHLTRRWNPKMRPYIFMEKNGIHIIDLKKTQIAIHDAANKLREIVSDGGTVLFVGTKKQAKGVIAQEAKRCGMNWVSERWLGGMLTNFSTIRKSISRMQKIDKMESDGTFEKITKKEQLFRIRERDKLRKILDGVETMKKMPNAIFVVDIKKESISINEALRLNIPIFAIVDTNCNPDPVNYVIPSNDDAVRAIEVITKVIADAVIEGNLKYSEVRAEKAAEKEKIKKQDDATGEEKKTFKPKIRKVKFNDKGERKDVKVADKKNVTDETSKASVDDYLECKDYAGEDGFHKFLNDEKKEHFFGFNKAGKTFLRSEGYSTEKAMLNGIESIGKNAGNEKRWATGVSMEGKHYYALKAGNGQEIARSCYYETQEEMEADYKWITSSEAGLAVEEK